MRFNARVTEPADFASRTRDELLRELAVFHEAGGRDADQPRRIRELLARLALDEMYQFVAILAPDGTLLDANRPALEAGGIARDAIVGRPFWEAHWWSVASPTQEELRAAVARASGGEFVRYEVAVLEP